MRIENNNLNELGLSKGEMRFWFITLVLVGILFAAMVIDTNNTIQELDEMMQRIARNMP